MACDVACDGSDTKTDTDTDTDTESRMLFEGERTFANLASETSFLRLMTRRKPKLQEGKEFEEEEEEKKKKKKKEEEEGEQYGNEPQYIPNDVLHPHPFDFSHFSLLLFLFLVVVREKVNTFRIVRGM